MKLKQILFSKNSDFRKRSYFNYSKRKNGQNLDFAQFLFRFILLVIIDFLKQSNGQSIYRFTLNIIFYFFFLLSTHVFYWKYDDRNNFPLQWQSKQRNSFFISIKRNLAFLLLLIIDVTELASWKFIKSALNNQALNAVNLTTINEYSGFKLYIILIILSCAIFLLLPFCQYTIQLPRFLFLFHILNSLFLFLFGLTTLHDFRDKNNRSLIEFDTASNYSNILRENLISKIDSKVEIINHSKALKNLILIQLESYPYEFLENEVIAPNLNNFSKIFEFIGPIESVPYSTWSIGATVLLQTGIPQIMPDTNAQFRDRFTIKYMTKIKGISDILKAAGYSLRFASNGDVKVMGFADWAKRRKYKHFLTTDNDKDLFDYYIDHDLERIDNETRNSNKRSLEFITNDETHAAYWPPKWCNFSVFEKFHKKQRCFYCVDYLVGKFVRKFMELKMYEHTVLAIFPDHHPFISDFLWYDKPIKYVFVLLPGIEKVEPKLKLKNFTYYDFAPTILDLVGIKKYKPEFPFGTNIYDFQMKENSDKHRTPDTNDLAVIYKFLHFERGQKIRNRLNISRPFKCYTEFKKSFYYSENPCNLTYN